MNRILFAILIVYPAIVVAVEPSYHRGVHVQSVSVESRIFFARRANSTEGWSILSVRPDGSGERVEVPFSSGMGEYNPSLSPDGTSLLFNTYRYGGWKIAVKDEDGPVKRWTQGTDYYTNPSFDATGNRVAFEHTRRSGTDVEVRTLGVEGEIPWAAGPDREERGPVWTPDGGLVYFDGHSGRQQIYLQKSEKGSPILLSDGSSNDFSPAVSPDGSRIAFYSDRTGHSDVFVLDLASGALTNLTETVRNKDTTYEFDDRTYWRLKASWAPDGSELVFMSPRDGNYELFISDADGTNMRRLTTTIESEITPVWANASSY